MIADANDLTDGTVLQTAICIVGAGAAGISLALQLIGSGLDVVMLESGALEPEAATQELHAGTVADERLHSPPDRYRQRRFGGSTTIWGGRSMPFDAIDFEPRNCVPTSGWRFGLEEPLPFYPDANRLYEAGDFRYTAEETFGDGGRPIIRILRAPASAVTHWSGSVVRRISALGTARGYGSRRGSPRCCTPMSRPYACSPLAIASPA